MLLKLRRSMVVVSFLSLVFVSACSKPEAEEAVMVDSGSLDGIDGSGSSAGVDSGSGDASFSPETVYFGYDQAGLSGSDQTKVTVLADYLRSNASAAVEVIGHCDERGSEEYNIALGSRRANAVKNYLVNSGVDSSRISTASYGEEQPAAAGHDESAYVRNRRAEFVLTVR